MLMNSFMLGKRTPLIVPATKGWYDPSNRAAYRTGTPPSANDSTDDVYALYNMAREDHVPTLWQNVVDNTPTHLSIGTLWNAFSSGSGKHLKASKYGSTQFIGPTPQNAANFPLGTDEGWIFTFFKGDEQLSGGAKSVFAYGGNGGVGCRGIGVYSTGGDAGYYITLFLNGSSFAPSIQHNVDSRGQRVLVGARFSTAQLELWVNGVLYSTSTTNPDTANDDVSMFQGPLAANGAYSGEIGNTIISGAITVAEREFYEGFICWTQGYQNLLPIGHTYKTIDPR